MLSFSEEPNVSLLGYERFVERVLNEGYNFVENEQYTANQGLDSLYENALVVAKQKNVEDVLLEHDGTLCRVYRTHDDINIWVGARDRNKLKEAREWIKAQIPEYENKDEETISVTFWSLSSNGPWSVHRRIEVPKWEEIHENYEGTVQKQLTQMMEDFKPSHGGQLILWEGNPGTGKTYSLRALGDAWREWANFHYITDPEEFFGEASYMISVLLQGHSDPYAYYDRDEDKKAEKWNVLILEDCGELLSADAKERTGQAVARLLNVVDGLIGQGLKILVLVTTNEPVKKFHPAVTRPGRCAAHIEYKPFGIEAANQWLKEHGSQEIVTGSSTIAELFGKIEGYEAEETKLTTVGFGR